MKAILIVAIITLSGLWADENNLREGVKAYNQKSYDKAKQYFELAVSKDESANAAYYLGKMYLYGEGTALDYKKAIEFLDFARDNGNVPSGCYLSEAYMNAKTNTSYIAYGLMKGLKQGIPHCKKMLDRYFGYQDF